MSDYLSRAVDNLVYGLRQMMNPDAPAVPLFREVKDVMFPLPTVYPNARLIPAGGTQGTTEGGGTGFLAQVFTVGLRVYVGKTAEQYDGELLRLMWRVQPEIMNYLNTYPDLVFTETQAADLSVANAHIAELNPDGVICRQTSRLGLFRDQPEHYGMEFAIEVPFYIETERDSLYFIDE